MTRYKVRVVAEISYNINAEDPRTASDIARLMIKARLFGDSRILERGAPQVEVVA